MLRVLRDGSSQSHSVNVLWLVTLMRSVCHGSLHPADLSDSIEIIYFKLKNISNVPRDYALFDGAALLLILTNPN